MPEESVDIISNEPVEESVPMSDDDGYEEEPNYVSFNENGELVSDNSQVGADGQEQAGNTNTGDDSQTTQEGFYKSQKEVDAAFSARLASERKKYQPDIDLSRQVKTLFNGLSNEEIIAKLTSTAAQDYAKQKNIPENIASEFINLRLGQQQREPEPEEPSEPEPSSVPENGNNPSGVNIQNLADEAESLEEQYGINVVEILSKDKDTARKVFHGEMSLKDVLLQQFMNRQEKPAKRVSPARSSNGSGGIYNSNGYLSDAAMKQIDEALDRGESVRF